MEILAFKSIDQINGEYTHAKHPRKLQLIVNQNNGSTFSLECCAHDRILVPRENISRFKPDKNCFLTERELNGIIQWLSARYDRAALPDAFNTRIHNTRKKRNKYAAKISEHVSGLYVSIHPFTELDENEQYSVNLLALVTVTFDGDLNKIEAEIKTIKDLLKKANMDVKYEVRKEDTVSVATIKEFKKFPLDYLSLRADPEHVR